MFPRFLFFCIKSPQFLGYILLPLRQSFYRIHVNKSIKGSYILMRTFH